MSGLSKTNRNRNILLLSSLVTTCVESNQLNNVASGSVGWTLTGVKNHDVFNQRRQSLYLFLNEISRGGSDKFEQIQHSQQYRQYHSRVDEYHNEEDENYKNDLYREENPRTYHETEDYYPDRYGYRNKAASARSSASIPLSILRILKHGDRQMGLLFLGSGTLLTLFGITLFFNKTLMRLGNLFFIAGVPLTIGPNATIGYFAKPEKIRATSCLLLGILLVFVGHPTFGIALELFGLLNLFGNMFPMIMFFIKQLPGIGTIFESNSFTSSSQKATTKDQNQKKYNEHSDYLYDDEEKDVPF